MTGRPSSSEAGARRRIAWPWGSLILLIAVSVGVSLSRRINISPRSYGGWGAVVEGVLNWSVAAALSAAVCHAAWRFMRAIEQTWSEVELIPDHEKERYLTEARRAKGLPTTSLVFLVALIAIPGVILFDVSSELVSSISFLLIAFAIVAVFWLNRNRMRFRLRALMARDGIPICIACGYDLRGHGESPRCPECGELAAMW